MEDRRLKAIAYMLTASFFFAAMTLCVRLGCARLPAMESLFVRGLVDSVVIVLLLLDRNIPILGQDKRSLFLRGTYGFLGVSCVFTSVLLIPVADATALFKSSALFMPFIARALLDEKLKLSRVTLAFVGFLGAALILKPSWNTVSLGGVIALSGSFFNGLAFASIRKLSDSEHPLVIMLAFLGLSVVYSGALAGYQFLMPVGTEWVYLALVAVFGLLGQYAVTLAFSAAPAGVIAPWNYFEIAFSLLLGCAFLNQFPDVFSAVGMLVLVISAIAITKT